MTTRQVAAARVGYAGGLLLALAAGAGGWRWAAGGESVSATGLIGIAAVATAVLLGPALSRRGTDTVIAACLAGVAVTAAGVIEPAEAFPLRSTGLVVGWILAIGTLCRTGRGGHLLALALVLIDVLLAYRGIASPAIWRPLTLVASPSPTSTHAALLAGLAAVGAGLQRVWTRSKRRDPARIDTDSGNTSPA